MSAHSAASWMENTVLCIESVSEFLDAASKLVHLCHPFMTDNQQIVISTAPELAAPPRPRSRLKFPTESGNQEEFLFKSSWASRKNNFTKWQVSKQSWPILTHLDQVNKS